MKFKLDENLGSRTRELFREAGHDVLTVRDQQLQGCPVVRFPPDQNSGIAVIRVPQNPSLPLLEQLIRQFLNALTTMSLEKKLWIVETGRIRIHQAANVEDEA